MKTTHTKSAEVPDKYITASGQRMIITTNTSYSGLSNRSKLKMTVVVVAKDLVPVTFFCLSGNTRLDDPSDR